ncbi:hypothetical protein ACWXVL_00010 [Mycoplasma sp. 128]|uniref:hypothetical protein n=1 Tax=Mycoplasma sp. 3341 TaxID=3447506 RepID=UPI003F65A89B
MSELKQVRNLSQLSVSDTQHSKSRLDAYRQEVFNSEIIKKVIKKLKLTDWQIKNGETVLFDYYSYFKTHNKLPNWSPILNANNSLDRDFSKESWYKSALMRDKFWLTAITPLERDLDSIIDKKLKKSSREGKRMMDDLESIICDTNSYWTKDLDLLKKVVSPKYSLPAYSLYLVDYNIFRSLTVLKFLAYQEASKGHSVALLDYNDLYLFYSKSSNEERRTLTDLLSEVDNLYISDFGSGSKPDWYVNSFISYILRIRVTYEKSTFITASDDYFDGKLSLITKKSSVEDTQNSKIIRNLKLIIDNGFKVIKPKRSNKAF